jgi:hypothetical protein
MNQRFKGLTRAGMGRPVGATNKIQRAVKECVAEFVEHNMEGAQALYDKLAKKNPEAALALLAKFAEFVLPRNAHITAEVGRPPKPPSLGFVISFENGGPGLPAKINFSDPLGDGAEVDQSTATPGGADIIPFNSTENRHE